MAFVLVPQISNALDAEGTTIINNFKAAYTNIFMPNKILTDTDLKEWNNIIKGQLSDYVLKNSSVTGIKDALLINSLNNLITTNLKMLVAITKSRKDIATTDLTNLEEIRADIINIETPLKNESYFVPSKKNAKEVLLFALEFMKGATETTIDQVKKPSRVYQPMDPLNEFPEAKNITDKRQQAFVILGLPKDASQADIKKAYYKLSLKWHPDRWSDKTQLEKEYAGSIFKVVENAYSTVKT